MMRVGSFSGSLSRSTASPSSPRKIDPQRQAGSATDATAAFSGEPAWLDNPVTSPRSASDVCAPVQETQFSDTDAVVVPDPDSPGIQARADSSRTLTPRNGTVVVSGTAGKTSGPDTDGTSVTFHEDILTYLRSGKKEDIGKAFEMLMTLQPVAEAIGQHVGLDGLKLHRMSRALRNVFNLPQNAAGLRREIMEKSDRKGGGPALRAAFLDSMKVRVLTPRQMGLLYACTDANPPRYARDIKHSVIWERNEAGEYLFPFPDVGLLRPEHTGNQTLRFAFDLNKPGMYALMLGINDYALWVRYMLLPRVNSVRHGPPLTGEALVRARKNGDDAHEAFWDDFWAGVPGPIKVTPEDAYFAMGYHDNQPCFSWEKSSTGLRFEEIRKSRCVDSDRLNILFAARARLLGNPLVKAWMERYPLPAPLPRSVVMQQLYPPQPTRPPAPVAPAALILTGVATRKPAPANMDVTAHDAQVLAGVTIKAAPNPHSYAAKPAKTRFTPICPCTIA